MTIQYSTSIRNDKLDAIETRIGPSAVLKIFSGKQPVNSAAPDPTGLLCTIVCPLKWMEPASNGSKSKTGVWAGTASRTGKAASWRLYAADGVTCGLQGNTTDMVFDNTNIRSGQTVTVSTFVITAGNS